MENSREDAAFIGGACRKPLKETNRNSTGNVGNSNTSIERIKLTDLSVTEMIKLAGDLQPPATVEYEQWKGTVAVSANVGRNRTFLPRQPNRMSGRMEISDEENERFFENLIRNRNEDQQNRPPYGNRSLRNRKRNTAFNQESLGIMKRFKEDYKSNTCAPSVQRETEIVNPEAAIHRPRTVHDSELYRNSSNSIIPPITDGSYIKSISTCQSDEYTIPNKLKKVSKNYFQSVFNNCRLPRIEECRERTEASRKGAKSLIPQSSANHTNLETEKNDLERQYDELQLECRLCFTPPLLDEISDSEDEDEEDSSGRGSIESAANYDFMVSRIQICEINDIVNRPYSLLR